MSSKLLSTWCSLYFPNGVSPVMEELIFFHDHTMIVVLMIIMVVSYLLMNSCLNLSYNLNLFEGQVLESVWTVFPCVFLLLVAFPSLRLLYVMEEMNGYEMSIKVLGHQWYWSYEYSDMDLKLFDSYMLSDVDSMFRLLDVDNKLIVPFKTNVRMIVSSMDVIHSWAIPSLGVKTDAIPGRLNQLLYMFNRVGLFSGQCSEICGANHSFMPIVISVIPRSEFLMGWWEYGRGGVNFLN